MTKEDLDQFQQDTSVLAWLLKKRSHDTEEWFTLNQIHNGVGIHPQLVASSLNRLIMTGYVELDVAGARDVYQATEKYHSL